jgi:hypothetical protein
MTGGCALLAGQRLQKSPFDWLHYWQFNTYFILAQPQETITSPVSILWWQTTH